MVVTVEIKNHKYNTVDSIAWDDVKSVYFTDDALMVNMKNYGCFGIPREEIVSMPCFFANNREAEKFYSDVAKARRGEEINAK